MSRSFTAAAMLACLSAVGMAGPNPHSFQETKYFFTSYVAKFNKNYYSVDEFLNRMTLFWETGERIRHHNAIGSPNSFIMGHNQFSDLTTAERTKYFGFIRPPADIHHELHVAKL